MNCERVRPYLTAHAANELPSHTQTWVGSHVSDCPECAAISTRHAAVRAALRALPDDAFEPPPGFAAAVVRRSGAHERRRMIPVPPVLPPEAFRLLSENRDAIVGATSAAVVGVGAAWLAWRALRNRATRPATQA